MPFPLAGAIAGSVIPGVINAASDMYANYQNRQFSREMFNKTQAANLSNWNLQNAYNTPEAQMNRFKDAGLNPNLIYGSSGDNSASNIPTPDVQPANYRAPHFDKLDVMPMMLAQADLKIKAAQANNLEVQTDILHQDAILRGIQAQRGGFDLDVERELRPSTILGRSSGAVRTKFDLDFARDTRDSQADLLSEHVRQTRVATDLSINRDAREALSNASTINEALERIKTMKSARATSAAERMKIYQEIELLKSDATIKRWEVELSSRNQTPHDGMWSRIIGSYLTDALGFRKDSTSQRLLSGQRLNRNYTPLSHPTNH